MDIKPGDLVFLTQEYESYIYERNPKLKIGMVNRLAKLEDIIDWDSPKGKKIKELRLKTNKWKDLPLEDCRYLFSVYYHDIEGRDGKSGVAERGVCLFNKNPKTGAPFFVKVPDWIYREINKKCETFTVQDK